MGAHNAETDQRPLYVLPDRWDHAIKAATYRARRDGARYQVRWFPPRGCWVVSAAVNYPPGVDR